MILWSEIEKSMELHRRQSEAKRRIEEIRKRQEESLQKLHIKHKTNVNTIITKEKTNE